jgi:hypothetical protein
MRHLLAFLFPVLISVSNFAAETATYGVKYNSTDLKNEVWRANDDGSETLLKQFVFPSGGWITAKSFADDKTGKLFLWDSGGGLSDSEKGFVVYDPATNSITTGVKEGYQDGYQATFQSVLKIDDLIMNDVDTSGDATSVIGSDQLIGASGSSIIASGTDSTDGTATTVIGSNDIVGADGDTLISKESDGSIHIGEDSLVTIEEAGVQQLYATDANGDSIDINIKEGTDLLLNGVSVSNSLGGITTNATNISTNTAGIATNSTSISTNTAGIATNSTNISTNTAGIATNSTSISTNTAGIATNAAVIENLRSSYSSAIASTVAMGQVEIADEGFSIGIGHGTFNGENALGYGLGYGGQFKNGSRFKLRASKSGDANGVGITISF